VSSPDLDDLRLLLAHAHTPKKIGFLQRAMLRLKSKFSRPFTQPVAFPSTPAIERKVRDVAIAEDKNRDPNRDVA
jgi:hypothetical protein